MAVERTHVSSGWALILSVLSISAFCVAPGLASASKQFEGKIKDGLEEYSRQRFHAAESAFEDAVMCNPLDARAHYYLGKTRLKLRDNEGARQEFKNAFKVDPFGPYGERSKAHLLDCAQESGRRELAPVDPKVVVQRAVEQINQQSNSAIRNTLEQSTRRADGRRRNAEFTASIIERQVDMDVRSARDNWVRSRNSWRRSYDPAVIRSIEDEGRRRAAYARQDHFMVSARDRLNSGKRALALQESANSLSLLLAERPQEGKPKLRAFGTNLYVRYYGKEDPTDQPPPDDPLLELRADPKRAAANLWSNKYRK